MDDETKLLTHWHLAPKFISDYGIAQNPFQEVPGVFPKGIAVVRQAAKVDSAVIYEPRLFFLNKSYYVTSGGGSTLASGQCPVVPNLNAFRGLGDETVQV